MRYNTNQAVNITGSFIQDQKHETKSEKFVSIQPAAIGQVLTEYGFDLVHLRTGKAKDATKANHQTTIARYRQNHELKVGGLHMDLVFKVPHLYGSIQAFLGTYRLVCGNGLVVGTKFFEAPRIRHTGDAQSQIESLIPTLVAKHDALIDVIQDLSARNVTPTQVAEFIRESASLRLGLNEQKDDSTKIISVQYTDLMKVRRQEDAGSDAFSVLNVVQENLMRYGMRYQTESENEQGIKTVRNMTARPITRSRQGETETTRSVDLNASLWDLASEILKAS